MLLETNSYEEDFPLSIQVVRVVEDPIHYHQDTEIVYVLSGEIRLKNGYHTYLLKTGDIFVSTGHEVHALYETDKENTVAILRVSNLFFTKYYPNLPKSCYRTYTGVEMDPRCNELRRLLLLTVQSFYKRETDYKQHCVDYMLKLIDLLNKDFNLFVFKNGVVVNIHKGNSILEERMSRIIQYLYQNHFDKITLKTLAQLEHLSEFYLSHTIKAFVGLSFRDFLCFARVEWSEMALLGTDTPIPTIAKDVGFSTTALYEKHFKRWFGRSPKMHRKEYGPLVKSPSRQGRVEPLAVRCVLPLIQSILFPILSQEKSSHQVYHSSQSISFSVFDNPRSSINPSVELHLSEDQMEKMKGKMERHLEVLGCNNLVIGEDRGIEKVPNFFNDSIGAAIRLMLRDIDEGNKNAPRFFMDAGDEETILKGQPTLLTSQGIPKPAYYGQVASSMLKGSLIHQGSFHRVIGNKEDLSEFTIVAFHQNDQIAALSSRNAGIHEVRDTLHSFQDELDLNLLMNGPEGEYLITRYAMSQDNTLFGFMEKLDFPNSLRQEDIHSAILCTVPKGEVYTEKADGQLNLNISFVGVGIQLIRIRKLL